jgi:hypothetical protein
MTFRTSRRRFAAAVTAADRSPLPGLGNPLLAGDSPLTATSRPRRVSRARWDARAAGADRRHDFVRAEMNAGGKCHPISASSVSSDGEGADNHWTPGCDVRQFVGGGRAVSARSTNVDRGITCNSPAHVRVCIVRVAPPDVRVVAGADFTGSPDDPYGSPPAVLPFINQPETNRSAPATCCRAFAKGTSPHSGLSGRPPWLASDSAGSGPAMMERREDAGGSQRLQGKRRKRCRRSCLLEV